MWRLLFGVSLSLPLRGCSIFIGSRFICLGFHKSGLIVQSIFTGILLLFCSAIVAANLESGIPRDVVREVNSDVPGYLARIERNSPREVEQALLKAERYYFDHDMSPGLPVIAFVLHGPEVEIFFRENYSRYKPIVDLAAKLSALNVVDIKVCRTRLRYLETDVDQLYPFVGSVPFGPAEIERLTGAAGFVYF